MQHRPIYYDQIATFDHVDILSIRRRNRPNQYGETDNFVLTSMLIRQPTVRVLVARHNTLRAINSRGRKIRNLVQLIPGLETLADQYLIRVSDLRIVRGHLGITGHIENIRAWFGEGNTQDHLITLALQNRVKLTQLAGWRACLDEPHPLKKKMMDSLWHDQIRREIEARQREMGKWCQDKLSQNQFFVSDCGTQFSLVEFPGATRVHAGPDRPDVVYASVYRDERESCYGPCHEDQTVGLLRVSIRNPGLAALPCHTTADKVHRVLTEYFQQKIRFIRPYQKVDLTASFEVEMDLWEEVFRTGF